MKYLITQVHADDGVGNDDGDVKFFLLEVDASTVQEWQRLQTDIPALRTRPGLAGLDTLLIRSAGVFYAVRGELDEEGVTDELLDLSGSEWVVLDALPDWWETLCSGMRTSADYMSVSQSSIQFTAAEHYGYSLMLSVALWNSDLDAIYQAIIEPCDATT